MAGDDMIYGLNNLSLFLWAVYIAHPPNTKRWTRRIDICYLVYSWCREGNGNSLQYSCLENPMDGATWWATVHEVAKSQTRLSDFTFTFHFPALEKEMATHSSVLARRIPGSGEPGGLPSKGSHRVRHDWSNLAAAAAAYSWWWTGRPGVLWFMGSQRVGHDWGTELELDWTGLNWTWYTVGVAEMQPWFALPPCPQPLPVCGAGSLSVILLPGPLSPPVSSRA